MYILYFQFEVIDCDVSNDECHFVDSPRDIPSTLGPIYTYIFEDWFNRLLKEFTNFLLTRFRAKIMAEGQGVQIPRVQLGSQGLEVKLICF